MGSKSQSRIYQTIEKIWDKIEDGQQCDYESLKHFIYQDLKTTIKGSEWFQDLLFYVFQQDQ